MSVAGSHRGRGLARVIAAEIFQQAVGFGLDKLVAEMLTVQKNAQRVFARLGFQEEVPTGRLKASNWYRATSTIQLLLKLHSTASIAL